MGPLELTLTILLFAMGLILVAAILIQQGKDKNLSGSIAGAADTFMGRTKAKKIDKFLSKLTIIVSILFAIVVICAYLFIWFLFVLNKIIAYI